MLSLIEDAYCFTDQDEQQQILQLAHSIMEGELEDHPFEPKKEPRAQFISDALRTISLDAGVFPCVRFRRSGSAGIMRGSENTRRLR